MSSSLADYRLREHRTSRNLKTENGSGIEEDPLTPIQSQSTEIYENGIDSNLGLGLDLELADAPDTELSDTSSVSFELYDDKFSREKLISQIKLENGTRDRGKDLNIGEFLLKHYKYRELGDISDGLAELIKGIDDDLVELVNVNYLSFINLGKSVDGSLDLIHDIKIDLSDYLKNLKSSNKAIEEDTTKLDTLQDSRGRLLSLRSIVERLITLSEMIECFDKLCSKFDKNEECTDMLKELVGLYFGINKMFLKLIQQTKDENLVSLANSGILLGLSKKMNGLKLEFKSLLGSYLTHLRDTNPSNEEIFEIFKLYQLLNLTEDFKKSL
ncbi:hypothetical protein PICMEDRAFT_14577 [Pichia membranifaciens NRRL Y-2026]|uniref:Conserved oligomeric Golgi complex subunit 2 n=1 Tax=Pichia membranifaciens NRRL Y-2026 TaxID=763406 RepID=A0A1E3NU59_9ASCO|nr:hypothetical protein PICMEDRAFT_14577 [Pichia membranifaciens NRRL Y-2026]ODQ49093.1 hypothetical protein PICMEDRAFT_14577 [Pichia membranifaciens NRRL Y-2026]